MRFKEGRTGQYRWHLARSVPAWDEAGRVVRWYGSSTDIHDRKRAEDAARFLASASATLAAVVDLESTLQKVAGLAVPSFADWSAVDLASEGGALRRLAVVHQDPAKVQLVQELAARYPPQPDAPVGRPASCEAVSRRSSLTWPTICWCEGPGTRNTCDCCGPWG